MSTEQTGIKNRDFSHKDLRFAKFECVDLGNASFRLADLTYAEFWRCRIEHTDFAYAKGLNTVKIDEKGALDLLNFALKKIIDWKETSILKEMGVFDILNNPHVVQLLRKVASLWDISPVILPTAK